MEAMDVLRPEEAAALVALTKQLSGSQSLAQITEIVTSATCPLLHADGITFVLREDELCYYADEDAISPLWKGKRFPMSACISGWCMKEGRPAVIGDIYKDERIPHEAYRPTFVQSLAMVPVGSEDPIAAIGAYWSNERTANPHEVTLLQAVASVSSLAIANFRLRNAQDSARREARVQSLLVSELGHRVRNSLCVIESIARQSARNAQSLEGFTATFLGRLHALSEAFHWLLDPRQQDVALGTVIGTALEPFKENGRIDVEGGHVEISPESALTVALLIHELATNAVKHGALSAQGQVRVGWTVRHGQGERQRTTVMLEWRETGGPPVEPPTRKGFGSRLLKDAVGVSLKGHSNSTFAPEGFRCEIEFPVPEAPLH